MLILASRRIIRQLDSAIKEKILKRLERFLFSSFLVSRVVDFFPPKVIYRNPKSRGVKSSIRGWFLSRPEPYWTMKLSSPLGRTFYSFKGVEVKGLRYIIDTFVCSCYSKLIENNSFDNSVLLASSKKSAEFKRSNYFAIAARKQNVSAIYALPKPSLAYRIYSLKQRRNQ